MHYFNNNRLSMLIGLCDSFPEAQYGNIRAIGNTNPFKIVVLRLHLPTIHSLLLQKFQREINSMIREMKDPLF